MQRDTSSSQIDPQDLLRRIAIIFGADCYASLRHQFDQNVRDYADHPDTLQAIEKIIGEYEERVTIAPRERFKLDASLIQETAATWNTGTLRIPDTIIPVYGPEWSHVQFQCCHDREQSAAPATFGIIFPGIDSLGDVNLLKYPWLWRELGHIIFTRAPGRFYTELKQALETYAARERKKSPAHDALARQRLEARIERASDAWRPTPQKRDWLHETALDLIALWCVGPAYLAAYEEMLEKDAPDPFQIKSERPPCYIRTRTLALGANALGWEQHTGTLLKTWRDWQLTAQSRLDHNPLDEFCGETIIDAICRWVFDGCREWKLPQCTPVVMNIVTARLNREATPESAAELVLAARIAYWADRSGYHYWQRSVLKKIIGG